MILLDNFSHEATPRRVALLLLSVSWGLPNLLVGVIAAGIAQGFGGKAQNYRGAVVVRWEGMRNLGGVCLGSTILLSPAFPEELIDHEWGHFRQHLRLGPFYFLLIGLPSLLHAIWFRSQKQPFNHYYRFYTEAWADHLGGIYHRHPHLHAHWSGYLWGGRPRRQAGGGERREAGGKQSLIDR